MSAFAPKLSNSFEGLVEGVALGTYGGGDAIRLYTPILSVSSDLPDDADLKHWLGSEAVRVCDRWKKMYAENVRDGSDPGLVGKIGTQKPRIDHLQVLFSDAAECSNVFAHGWLFQDYLSGRDVCSGKQKYPIVCLLERGAGIHSRITDDLTGPVASCGTTLVPRHADQHIHNTDASDELFAALGGMTPAEAGMSDADAAAILEALGGGGGGSPWQMGSDSARISIRRTRRMTASPAGEGEGEGEGGTKAAASSSLGLSPSSGAARGASNGPPDAAPPGTSAVAARKEDKEDEPHTAWSWVLVMDPESWRSMACLIVVPTEASHAPLQAIAKQAKEEGKAGVLRSDAIYAALGLSPTQPSDAALCKELDAVLGARAGASSGDEAAAGEAAGGDAGSASGAGI